MARFRRLRVLIGAVSPPAPPPLEGPAGRVVTPIAERRGPLEWRQLGHWWSPWWELTAEGDRLAVFRLATSSLLRRAFTVETTTARWQLRRRGLFGPHEVTREGDSEPLLRYRPGWWRGGSVLRRDGDPLRWKPGFARRGGTIENAEGFPIVSVKLRSAVFRIQGETRLEDAGGRMSDAEALVVLAWWLILEAPRHHGS